MEAFFAGLIGFLIGKGIPREDAEGIVKALEKYLGFEPPVGLTGFALKDMEEGKEYKTAVVIRGKTYNAKALEDVKKHHAVCVLSKRGACLEVAPQIIARSQDWYDRNPQPQGGQYNAIDEAPHSMTKRFSYTVPSGKKGFLEQLSLFMYRTTVATSLKKAYAWANVRGFSSLYCLIETNNIGDEMHRTIGHSTILQTGEDVCAYTMDFSSGGTFNYHLSFTLTEFDA